MFKMWEILHIFFLCSVFCYYSEGRRLLTGQVAYKVDLISPHHHTITVTNGAYVIKAAISNANNDVISCIIIPSTERAQKLLRHRNVALETVGVDKISQMLDRCQQLRRHARDGIDDDKTFNKNLTDGKPFDGDFKTGAPSGAGSHMAIFPGTKWCGYENVAQSMQDLGVHNLTDACCRTHDHCPYYIDRFESKYHYYNAYPWTISHCDCDQHLYDCLKRVDTATSNKVGKLFFGLLNVQCFQFEQGKYCADSSSILSKLWCTKKTTGEKAVVHTFGHKWGDKTDESASDLVG